MRRNPQSLLTPPRKAVTLPQAPKRDHGDVKIWERGQPSTWTVSSAGGVIKAILPYGPSANDYWDHRVVTPRGGKPFVQTYLSKDAEAYREMVAKLFDVGMVGPTAEPVIFTMTLYRPVKAGDLDNRVKPLLDALTGNAWKDDKQVVEAHLYLDDDKVNPRIEVEIRPHAAKSNGVLEF